MSFYETRPNYICGPSVEFPKHSGRYVKIKVPFLSTIYFKCPICNAQAKEWCIEKEPETSQESTRLCKERIAIYDIVYKRYIKGIQNYSIPFISSHERKEKLIQEMIQEALKES